MFPASTTKIVTAILVLENHSLDEKVTASYDAVMSIPSGYSTADIQIEEELTVEQLLNFYLYILQMMPQMYWLNMPVVLLVVLFL